MRKLAASTSLFASMTIAGVAVAHPLDGLSPDEINATTEILAEAGRTGEESRWPLIELYEPEKAEVLAWEEGDPQTRRALVNVATGEGVFRGVVNLTDRSVESWEPAEGEPMLLVEEFLGAMGLALSHPDMIAGLEARGLTPDDVFCLPLTAGAFGDPDEEGRRLMKVPCYVLPEGSNWYAKPIEGLIATVDLAAGEVVNVIDTGVVPVPEDAWGYTEEEIAARDDMELRPEMNPATVTQEGEPNYTIDGSEVSWDIWSFRWRIDKRPGVVLSEIMANDRQVLYQAHLSEVFVPYMDPDEGWYWRTYMDSGEYGFGIFLSPLRAGVDCPSYATFLPAVVHADDGTPLEIPDAVCIFERNVGDPAWRHFEVFAQGPDQFTPTEGRPATELVVRSASEVGNYDYLIDYRFDQSGRVRVMVGSTGLDAVKGVASTSSGRRGGRGRHQPRHADRAEPGRAEPRPLLQLPAGFRHRRASEQLHADRARSGGGACGHSAPLALGDRAVDAANGRRGALQDQPRQPGDVPRGQHGGGDQAGAPSDLHDHAGRQRGLQPVRHGK